MEVVAVKEDYYNKGRKKMDTGNSLKVEPTNEEMHAVVVSILKRVDFNTTRLSDINEHLCSHFGMDLIHRKAEVMDIITYVINNMSDDEDEGDEAEENIEAGDDAEKDEDDDDGGKIVLPTNKKRSDKDDSVNDEKDQEDDDNVHEVVQSFGGGPPVQSIDDDDDEDDDDNDADEGDDNDDDAAEADEEDMGAEYLVQPIGYAKDEEDASVFELEENGDDEDGEKKEENYVAGYLVQPVEQTEYDQPSSEYSQKLKTERPSYGRNESERPSFGDEPPKRPGYGRSGYESQEREEYGKLSYGQSKEKEYQKLSYKQTEELEAYTGSLLGGTQIYLSCDVKMPFKFTFGQGQIMRGWDPGIETMKKDRQNQEGEVEPQRNGNVRGVEEDGSAEAKCIPLKSFAMSMLPGDLSNWKFINALDADSEEHKFLVEDEPEGQHHPDEDNGDKGNGYVSHCTSNILPILNGHNQIHEDHWGHCLFHMEDLKSHANVYNYHDDDDVDDDGYDLNDELVPWSVSDRFGGRERMRKLGKRAFTKMYNSKRSPKTFMKPGYVRGKYGLGLKHSC